MNDTESRLVELFRELVPMQGKADTVAGEIVRAINHIGHRNTNDGDHIGVGYGNETCNAPARFLARRCGSKVAGIVKDLWGVINDDMYDVDLAILEREVLAYLDAHPELRGTPNSEDMYDYLVREVDLHWWDDEDDEDDEDEEGDDDDWDEEEYC